MASPAVRISRSICRSWSSAGAGISRNRAASSSVMQSRAYSDQGFKDPFSAEPAQGSEDPPADQSLSFDSPSGSPPSDGFPESGSKPVEQTEQHKNDYIRNSYPHRTFRSPRGVYKAIILGEVGQVPIQKVLKSGKSVTIFSVGTGGMYNNRRPFEDESPQEFAERGNTQWHRVAVYHERISGLVMEHLKVGYVDGISALGFFRSQVYLEGNIESRVYNDPNSGVVKRIREIAVRSNGRLMFMEGAASQTLTQPPIPVRDEPFSVPPADPLNETL